MKDTVYIITSRSSPRLEYVLSVIFTDHLGLSYELIVGDDADSQCPEGAIKINYSRVSGDTDSIKIYQHNILFEDHIYAQQIEVIRDAPLPYFFQSFAHQGDYHFDLFALVFYMLSRYEEHLRFIPDQHERFSSTESLSHRAGFLKIPIVDLWIIDLKEKLEQTYSISIPLGRSFQIKPTVDIDTPFAYLNRPIHYHLGAIGRDIVLGRWKRIRQRINTYLSRSKDLFDTYDKIADILKDHEKESTFFFLMNLHLPHDQNFSKSTKPYKQLVKDLASRYAIGIHPSLQAQKSQDQWLREKRVLEKITDRDIYKSRQHFLHLLFPSTYQQLVDQGIREDYSMMYHDNSGFRAGTSVPFYWYNLKKEQKENLIIHPAMTMDVTLKMYQNLSPSEAIVEVQSLQSIVEKVKGSFSFIWHNSSFSELYGWAGWEKVLETCVTRDAPKD